MIRLNLLPVLNKPIRFKRFCRCLSQNVLQFTPIHERTSNIVRCLSTKDKPFDESISVIRPKYTLAQRLVVASPTKVRPYLELMRIDRPIGSWLLFWPCAWSLSLASPAGSLPDPYLLAIFALGSVVMRGAGCTINDMWDRNYDGKVTIYARKCVKSSCCNYDCFRLLVLQVVL